MSKLLLKNFFLKKEEQKAISRAKIFKKKYVKKM